MLNDNQGYCQEDVIHLQSYRILTFLSPVTELFGQPVGKYYVFYSLYVELLPE